MRPRSSARVRALIDAAAHVTGRVGVERVTTNLVAEAANCSIGTLYRYFPDRVSVLRGLALRHASTLHEDCQRELALVAPDDEGLGLALIAMFERFTDRFRHEAGWSAIGFLHALDMPLEFGERHFVSPPLRGKRTPREQIARDIASRFSDRETALRDLASDLETALLFLEVLVARAFARDRRGDSHLLLVARDSFHQIVASVVAGHRRRSRGSRGDGVGVGVDVGVLENGVGVIADGAGVLAADRGLGVRVASK